MKSPVYGGGRNRKHRPKNGVFKACAGNVNMKGKKTKRMRCWCCYCIDLREKMKLSEKIDYTDP